MIRFRGQTIVFSDAKTLLDQRRNLDAGGLACQADAGVAVPSMRDRISFDVLVDDWRCGPLQAEVVFANGNNLGLQLADESVNKINQLFIAVMQRNRRVSAEFARIAEELEKKQKLSGGTGRDSTFDVLDSVTRDSNEQIVAGQSTELPPFFGELAGRVCLGTLSELFFMADEVPPPAKASLLQILRFLHAQRASGRLVLRAECFTKTVWLKRGVPMTVTVSPVKEDETLGQILIKARWVEPKDLGHALRWARTQKIGLGTALVQAGKLEQSRLSHALAHQTYRRMKDLFAWNDARFEFEPDSNLPPPPHHPVTVPRLFLEFAQELLRNARTEELNLMLKCHEDCFPVISASEAQLRQLVPNDKTRQTCKKVFDGSRDVRHALSASTLGRPKTVRLLAYLEAAGAVDMPPEPHGVSINAAFVDERLRSMQTQDCFQRLNIPYTIHPSDIEAAWKARCELFAQGSVYHQENRVAATRISEALKQTFSILGDDCARRKHRQDVLGASGVEILRIHLEAAAALAEIHGDTEKATCVREAVADL